MGTLCLFLSGGFDNGGKLTLNVGNALLEDLLEGLGVLELLLDLGDDGGGELLLLALLDLALVADPGVEDGLGLGGDGRLLLEVKGLGLEPWRPRRGSW